MSDEQGGIRVYQASGEIHPGRLVVYREARTYVRVISTGYLGMNASNYSGLGRDGLYKRNSQTSAIGVAVDTTQCNVPI